MSSKTKLRTVAEIAEILRPHCVWEMSRYLQSVAIDQAIAEAAKTLDFSLQSAAFSFNADPAAVAADLTQRCDSDAGRNLAALLAARYVIDQCSELPAIRARLAPIFAELATAQESEAAAAHQAALAAAELREKLESEKAAALRAIDEKFAPQLAAIV